MDRAAAEALGWVFVTEDPWRAEKFNPRGEGLINQSAAREELLLAAIESWENRTIVAPLGAIVDKSEPVEAVEPALDDRVDRVVSIAPPAEPLPPDGVAA